MYASPPEFEGREREGGEESKWVFLLGEAQGRRTGERTFLQFANGSFFFPTNPSEAGITVYILWPNHKRASTVAGYKPAINIF